MALRLSGQLIDVSGRDMRSRRHPAPFRGLLDPVRVIRSRTCAVRVRRTPGDRRTSSFDDPLPVLPVSQSWCGESCRLIPFAQQIVRIIIRRSRWENCEFTSVFAKIAVAIATGCRSPADAAATRTALVPSATCIPFFFTTQRDMAHFTADHGFNFVVGHHIHQSVVDGYNRLRHGKRVDAFVRKVVHRLAVNVIPQRGGNFCQSSLVYSLLAGAISLCCRALTD